jgi:hypothetical protein
MPPSDVVMLKRLSFVQLISLMLIAGVIAGVVGYVLDGATTNKGTTGAIAAETSKINQAEKLSCTEHGRYAPLATLEREGLLPFRPIYNSIVYVPGPGCGTIVVGSPAYQSQAG